MFHVAKIMIAGNKSDSDLKRMYTEQGESVLRAFLSEKIGGARQGYQSLLIMGLYLSIPLEISRWDTLRTQMICHISKYIWLVFCRYLMEFGNLRWIRHFLFSLYSPCKIANFWSFIFMLIDGKMNWNFDYGFSDSRFSHLQSFIKIWWISFSKTVTLTTKFANSHIMIQFFFTLSVLFNQTSEFRKPEAFILEIETFWHQT